MGQNSNSSGENLDLFDYARFLWRWKWLIAVCAILAGVAGLLVSRAITPIYEASTSLLVSEAPDAQTSDYNALLMSERLARTYSEMLVQRSILEAVIADLDLDMPVRDLGEAVQVQPVRDTQLVEVLVEHEDPYTAADIANTLVGVFQERNSSLQESRFAESKASLERQLERLNGQIEASEAAIAEIDEPAGAQEAARLERLQSELAQYQSSYSNLLASYEELRVAEAGSVSNLVQVEPAQPDLEPVRPRTLLNTAVALALGAMLGLGGALLIEYRDTTVKTPEQIEHSLDLPVVGTIAEIPESGADTCVYVTEQPRSPVAEAFRALRTNIQFASVDRPIRTLLITSAGPGEGKSTVCTNLGAVLTQSGLETVILEADLRRPRIHRLLGLRRGYGLSDLFVQKDLALDGAVQTTCVPRLTAVASGALPPNPAELLGSERMSGILDALIAAHDLVLIDSAPASVVTDPVVLSARVDGVLLVVEPGKSELPAVGHTVKALRRAGANLIGVVFNNVPLKHARYYGSYRYQYLYSYENGEGESDRAAVDRE